MLRYDVTYYLNERRQADSDTNVPKGYLHDLHRQLRPGETAYARCLNGGRENDREIDAHGMRPAKP